MKPLSRSLFIFLILCLSACAPAPDPDASLRGTSTAARMTVEALQTRMVIQPTFTRTPIPPTPITPTATITKTMRPTRTNTPLPTVVTPWNTCDVATYISETISDKIVMDPGAGFIKTWTIQNSGTCAWDKNYKFVFESGEAMTDVLELSFITGKQKVEPGQQITISMNLISPMDPGNYLGFWKLANEDGYRFGLGGSADPLWVNITVGQPSFEMFKVTSVKAFAVPNNYQGSCRKNGFTVTLLGRIKTNKAGVVTYKWVGSDGAESAKVETIVFYGADTQEVFRTFVIEKGFHYGSAQLKIISPNYLLSEKGRFNIECLD